MSVWHVEMVPGQVRSMSLDELDAAFQEGLVSELTRIREDGSTEWTTLGVVAGLDDDPTDVHAMPAPNNGPNSLSPSVLSVPTPMAGMAPTAPTSSMTGASALDDDDDLIFRPKKKPVVLLSAIGGTALALALGIIGVTQLSRLDAKTIDAKASNALAAPPPATTQIPQANEANDKSRLTEDQKRALLEQDGRLKADAEKKKAERAASQPAPRAGARSNTKSNDPFVSSGNKYDPLNGAL